MQIIDCSSSIGIRFPGHESVVFWDDPDNDSEFVGAEFFGGILLAQFPDALQYSQPQFAELWQAHYDACLAAREDEDDCLYLEDIIEKFEAPYIVLEHTSGGMACGPASFTIYFFLDDKYAESIKSMLVYEE